jgi:adenine specific DNA methylase Mod
MDLMGIIAGFKPLLWFVKDYRGDIQTLVADTVTGTGREKEFHEWQQAENEAAHFIEPLTSDDGTVVDFFAGGGTTLVAARNLKRRYIGFEIDPQRAARAAERLTEM